MRRIVNLGIFLTLLVSLAMPAAIAMAASGADRTSSPRTYTVLVGNEDTKRGVGVMSFYPSTLSIHVGDTVIWKVATHEIHTVSFLAGQPMPALLISAGSSFPPGAMQINPLVAFPAGPTNGMYDSSTYANSGILSTDPGNATEYRLTFTKEGSFSYLCLVHGMMMSGVINVVPSTTRVLSPDTVAERTKVSMKLDLVKARRLYRTALSQVPKPVKNSDGTTSYTVLIGYSKDQYDVMSFLPKRLVVHPGDQVTFMLSNTDVAPHTVTFLNGGADIPFVIPVPNPPGPPTLLFNPEVALPSANAGQPLTRNGVYNSGLLVPGSPATSYTLTIGDIQGWITYQCLLHDTSGMIGFLKVAPKDN